MVESYQSIQVPSGRGTGDFVTIGLNTENSLMERFRARRRAA